jgi:hypothetical protein
MEFLLIGAARFSHSAAIVLSERTWRKALRIAVDDPRPRESSILAMLLVGSDGNVSAAEVTRGKWSALGLQQSIHTPVEGAERQIPRHRELRPGGWPCGSRCGCGSWS